jgi:hypothetical protein
MRLPASKDMDLITWGRNKLFLAQKGGNLPLAVPLNAVRRGTENLILFQKLSSRLVGSAGLEFSGTFPKRKKRSARCVNLL